MSAATHLTEQQRIGAALLVLFAVLHYDEARHGWWYMHAVDWSHSCLSSDLAGCVWWAIRFANEDDDDFRDVESERFVSYLEHVCRNRRVLSREAVKL